MPLGSYKRDKCKHNRHLTFNILNHKIEYGPGVAESAPAPALSMSLLEHETYKSQWIRAFTSFRLIHMSINNESM